MEEKERAEYLEALHGFVRYREKLGELGIVKGQGVLFFWDTLKFDKLIEVMGDSARAKVEKGSGSAGHEEIGTLSRDKLREIAQVKAKDLSANSIEEAERIIEGTARSMGIKVE